MGGRGKVAASLEEALAEWRRLEAAVLGQVVVELQADGARIDVDQLRAAVTRVRSRLQAGLEARG